MILLVLHNSNYNLNFDYIGITLLCDYYSCSQTVNMPSEHFCFSVVSVFSKHLLLSLSVYVFQQPSCSLIIFAFRFRQSCPLNIFFFPIALVSFDHFCFLAIVAFCEHFSLFDNCRVKYLFLLYNRHHTI